MTVRLYLPGDSSALSVGAEQTAEALIAEAQRRGSAIELIRNGSRGLFWLEPLLEVVTPGGRFAYGPVTAEDVAGLFDAGLLQGGHHPLALGPTEEIPWLKRQRRLTCARIGLIDPASLSDFVAHGGYRGLQQAFAIGPEETLKTVADSGLRGRGGAAFATGRKWRTVAETPATQKYIVCNADEGDSGTFADRLLLEGDPFALIEGMTIAGFATGATEGYIYLRCEYPHAARALRKAIATARSEGHLGENILGSGHHFDLQLRLGAGAYICGEESALLESLEGRRGQVRFRPPLPAVKGLFGAPTVVNNVITLTSVPTILAEGADSYRALGSGQSRGTLPIQLGGNIRHGGLIELPFGVTLNELLHDHGGGSASGRPIRAVQVGGPLGAYHPVSQFDTAIDYEALAAIGGMLGHGGIVVFDDSVDLAEQARHAMAFCAHESCGKCTPCRIGSTRGLEVIDRLRAGQEPLAQQALLRDLCHTLTHASLCGLGSLTPYPVLSALDHFPEDFQPRPVGSTVQ